METCLHSTGLILSHIFQRNPCFSFCINIAIQAAKIVAFISKTAKKIVSTFTQRKLYLLVQIMENLINLTIFFEQKVSNLQMK